MKKILELRNVNKIYGTDIKTQVLYDINLAFDTGSFNSIIGQSGSGKSTLLNIIGTLDTATSGQVLIDGNNITDMSANELADYRNKTIGFVFQFHYLLPEFTALENVLIPYNIQNKPVTKEVIDKAKERLKLVGLEKVMNNPSTKMSGGQQQRTAIARALMNDPKMILADEPTGNLDSDSTETIYELLRSINEEYKTTFIVITHDRKIAEKADRIIEIKDGKINLDIYK
ncbi:MAG TPA: ABC transporter ATP-binding protein [Clostridia bacterium]|nr:ABC transporter ATP-binding protein [Clostridia bacterium]MDD3971320.1 ABC transporter ATP-binding protein [Clostridia bacterium]HPJ75518.1 ABC transporter ATP-binding protein [Clostridia bacterium]HXK71755.1 ABC transporter ATP-binding protein [Clostridia bacterium]